jgi:hypothetical protein
MELLRSETAHPSHQFLACPAEPLVGRVAEPEDGKIRLIKKVRWEVGTEEHFPEADHRPGFRTGARRREDEDDQGLTDQVFLGQLGG